MRITVVVKPMTIAIGINFGTYILLAADTRTTYYDWIGHIISYTDESVKIQKTSMGLITGAGSKHLLDSVKDRLRKEEVTHTDRILKIIREERLKYQRLYWKSAVRDLLKITGWIFSYATVEDNDLKLRLAIFHPSLSEHKLALYTESDPAVISPHEVTEEVANEIGDFLRKKVKPFKEFAELPYSIQYHWSIIARLIRKIQPLFPSISSFSQIGVHAIEGLMGISPILKNTESKVSIRLT